LATALLTALVAIAGRARTKVLAGLSRGGPLAGIKVAAAEPDLSQLDNDDAKPGAPRDLDESTRQRIAELPDVRTVIPIVSAQMVVVPPDPPVRPDVMAQLPPTTVVGPRNATTTSPAPSPI